MAFIARSKWRQDQRDIALAGGKPSEKEPDWGLDEKTKPIVNPQDSMSYEELQAHYAARKARRPKNLAEMRERGTVTGASE